MNEVQIDDLSLPRGSEAATVGERSRSVCETVQSIIPDAESAREYQFPIVINGLLTRPFVANPAIVI
jgi:hypothetical protein